MTDFNWGDYKVEPGASGDFLKEDQKLAIVFGKIPFFVTGIGEDVNEFQGKTRQRWLVQMVLADGSEKVWGLGKGNASRDRQMLGLKGFLESTGEPVKATIVKDGKMFYLSQVV